MVPSNSVYVDGGPAVTGDGLNTFVQTVDTLDGLRGFIGVDNQSVFVLGGATVGDGTGGQYYWDGASTGPDNGTTIIMPFASGVGAWIQSPFSFTRPMSIILTTDRSYTPFGPAGLIVAVEDSAGSVQGIIGYCLNNAPASTNILPAGVIGYGKLSPGSNGNAVFGMYGLAELDSTTGSAIGAEFTVRNFTGLADVNLPPNEAIGTGTRVPVGLQVTAGGGYYSSIGIQIGPEGGSSVGFNTGIYMRPGAFAQYGLFIDSMASGTQTSAVIQNNGDGINLQLGTTGTPTPANAVIAVYDQSNAGMFSVRQNGDVYMTIDYLAAATEPTTPAAGLFALYMDTADNTLKCKGPSGTVTPLGVP